MNPPIFSLTPYYAVIIYIISVLTAMLILKFYKYDTPTGRYETLDGIRGLLALGVFLHHSNYIYGFILTGKWRINQSNLYDQFGMTGVALFFMITAFLFIGKLLDSKDKIFDWKRYFISRFYRIAPLYYFSVLIIFVYTMIITGWRINTSIANFSFGIFTWLTFWFTKSIGFNGLEWSRYINAAVVWTLTKEWVFYLSLPILSLAILKAKPSKALLVLCGALLMIYFLGHGVNVHILHSFVGGGIAAYLIRYTNLSKILSRKVFGIAVIALLYGVIQFPSAYNFWCKSLIILVFIIITSGNDVFGILKSRPLKLLSEISYGIYLMHGIVAFTTLYFIIGFDNVRQMANLDYSYVMMMITPIMIMLCLILNIYIEQPYIRKGKTKTFNNKLFNKLFDKSNALASKHIIEN